MVTDEDVIIDAHGKRTFEQHVVWDHPVEHIEPQLAIHDQLRDCRLLTIHLLNDFATLMLGSLTGPPATAVRDALVKLFGISYGMGLNVCDGLTMTERAEMLGVERATLSKVAVAWNIAHDLLPSFHQKPVEANEKFAAARRAVVQSNGSNGGRHASASAA